VIKINFENIRPSISVYPNPLVGNKINLQLTGQPSGKYQVRLFNAAGQAVLSETINHPGGNFTETIHLHSNLPDGIYQLEIIKPGGKSQTIKLNR
jgi:hypothetical protein